MAVRPAVITATAYYFGAQSAQQISIIIFSVAIAMLLMSIDPYRAYYKRHFNDQNASHEFVIYIIIIVTWISLVSAVMFTTMAILHIPIPICVLSVAMFIGEKFADETLRFHLFRKALITWSNLVIKRSGMQLLGLIASLLIYRHEHAFLLLLISYTLGWVVAFQGPARELAAVIRKNHVVFLAKKFYRDARLRVSSSILLMATSLMSSSPSYFDKVVTLLTDEASLPLFLIASMAFSLVQVFVDFFFVSRIRLELLQNTIGLRQLIFSRKLFYCIAMGIAGGAFIIAIEALLLKGIYRFDLGILALVASINVILSVTVIPQQIVYWRDGPRGIFIAELGFFLPASVAYLSFFGVQWTLASALSVIAFSLAARFISYVAVSRHGVIVGRLLTAMGRRDH